MMLKVLMFSALLCLALVNGTKPKKGKAAIYKVEAKNEKRGDCPVVPSGNNVTLAACNTTCPGGSNCCSSDTNCTGIQKCCNTSCGMACMNPEYSE
uniref:WAP domain-containing protein n=1 Tax=Xenopus tropicalis TaxID=8364 RepID=A0A803JWA8_XENTR